jgi:hypothetical protein
MQHARKRSVMKTLFSSCEPDLVVRLCVLLRRGDMQAEIDHVKKETRGSIHASVLTVRSLRIAS